MPVEATRLQGMNSKDNYYQVFVKRTPWALDLLLGKRVLSLEKQKQKERFLMGSPIRPPESGPDYSAETTQHFSAHLELLRSQMTGLAVEARVGPGEANDRRALADRIERAEHAVVDRLIRTEQVALARLREETRQPLKFPLPERMFKTMPDDITRRFVLPFLDLDDLINLAAASHQGVGAIAGAEVQEMRQQLSELSTQHPVLREIALSALAAKDSESFGQGMQELKKGLETLDHRAALQSWAELYEALRKRPQTALERFLRAEIRRHLATEFLREIRDLRRDREMVLEAVLQNGFNLRYAAAELRRDREIVFAAVKDNGNVLAYADPELCRDRGIVLQAVSMDGCALQYADPALRADREIVLEAVRQNGYALEHAAPELRRDREIILVAVRQTTTALRYADPELRRDPELLLAAIRLDPRVLEVADPELLQSKQFFLKAVCVDRLTLRFLDPGLRSDRSFFLDAVRFGGAALAWSHSELRADREIVLEAVRQNGLALQFADAALRADREIVLAAVRQNGLALQFADAALQEDPEIVVAAVQQRNAK
jgi:hypothetical protein